MLKVSLVDLCVFVLPSQNQEEEEEEFLVAVEAWSEELELEEGLEEEKQRV